MTLRNESAAFRYCIKHDAHERMLSVLPNGAGSAHGDKCIVGSLLNAAITNCAAGSLQVAPRGLPKSQDLISVHSFQQPHARLTRRYRHPAYCLTDPFAGFSKDLTVSPDDSNGVLVQQVL